VPQVDDLIHALVQRGHTVCTGESLTGGLLCATLTGVPGASDAVLGAVVSYSGSAKRDVLGVPASVLDEHGAVSAQTAAAMARHARALFGATWALSTTGVAGPAEQEGRPVGTVHVAVDGPRCAVRDLHLHGDRASIRAQSCREAVELLLGLLA
jgi:nicotinamide-nucleotide amidase